jgi:hypothetical protein
MDDAATLVADGAVPGILRGEMAWLPASGQSPHDAYAITQGVLMSDLTDDRARLSGKYLRGITPLS